MSLDHGLGGFHKSCTIRSAQTKPRSGGGSDTFSGRVLDLALMWIPTWYSQPCFVLQQHLSWAEDLATLASSQRRSWMTKRKGGGRVRCHRLWCEVGDVSVVQQDFSISSLTKRVARMLLSWPWCFSASRIDVFDESSEVGAEWRRWWRRR